MSQHHVPELDPVDELEEAARRAYAAAAVRDGRRAYEFYGRAFTGLTDERRPLPDWDALDDATRDSWIAAGRRLRPQQRG